MSRRVSIVDYDPDWTRLFEEEKAKILDVVGDHVVSARHVGSTSVPGLAAKPIIDILIGLETLDDAQHCIAPLESLGYRYVPEHEKELPMRRYFSKKMPHDYHIHMVETTSEFWDRILLFRDYLSAHPQTADEYAALKKRLADQYGEDREGYTNAKTDFIRGIEAKARQKREQSR